MGAGVQQVSFSVMRCVLRQHDLDSASCRVTERGRGQLAAYGEAHMNNISYGRLTQVLGVESLPDAQSCAEIAVSALEDPLHEVPQSGPRLRRIREMAG